MSGTLCENIEDSKPNVVAGVKVFVTRVPEANDAFEVHDVEGSDCRKNRQRKTPGLCGTGRFEIVSRLEIIRRRLVRQELR